ncbi:MAG: excinuclease ABC subunit UvrB [Dehalococcoidia bacterium]|nr:excinuclease ABC subunit UvrB [Dehalococcoidia bacterium]
MSSFNISSDYKLTGDQPSAINQIVEGLESGYQKQTLVGVTGSGKTFTMANVIANLQRPTLVIAHNKTLAAQLTSEFKEFFPDNAVEYFVSYYDYYQPEAYIPRTDTYIEKDAEINDEIDKLRHSATRSLRTRRDVLIVASVSCIYGLGSPEEYQNFVVSIERSKEYKRSKLIRDLVGQQYERTNMDLARGKFRVRGDSLEILPAYEEIALRFEFWGDNVERIVEVDPITGEILKERIDTEIYPAKHFVTSKEKLQLAINDIQLELEERLDWFKREGKLLEAQRLESRTLYDIEMLREAGYCSGVENYSRHLGRRSAGSTPWCLLDYFPEDSIFFIDESHMTVPQLNGMYHGDLSRKKTLVEHGFRLPSAIDNRPLHFQEFEEHVKQVVYVSATPGKYEYENSQKFVEQIIRPTGLLDPTVEIKPTDGQVDDLLHQIRIRISKGERCLVTTLTKKMSEELADYLKEVGVKTHYLHSEIDTLERIEILRDLRLGIYDVVVGINLLREGLDLPEVSLVAILDADKEGYLRSESALVQTMGRAARHIDGHVIMYADKVTRSMNKAIEETSRRRVIQERHNQDHGVTPQGIRKAIRDINDRLKASKDVHVVNNDGKSGIPKDEIVRIIKDLESQMKVASRNLEFEKAALIRDEIIDLRKIALDSDKPEFSMY